MMGYSFHAVDRTGLLTMPSEGIQWDEHPNWYDLHREYWTDYHAGGWLSTGYWLGPSLQYLLNRAGACADVPSYPMPEMPGEVEEWLRNDEDEDDRSMPESVRAYLSLEAPAGKVLMFKFLEHEGFIVTPAECLVIDRVITDAYANGDMGVFSVDEVEALTHFGGYARWCADHGGFSVD